MPTARVWTDEMDAMIREGCRTPGMTWEAIAQHLAGVFGDPTLHRAAIIHRGQKLRCRPCGGRARAPLSAPGDPPAEVGIGKAGVNRGPLKAGHPLTWELLVGKNRPYPPPELHLLSKKQS